MIVAVAFQPFSRFCRPLRLILISVDIISSLQLLASIEAIHQNDLFLGSY
ncbi:hypothetical protein ACI0FT_00496 [Alcaligenes nematophilus]